jgi:hypothetical protein
MPRSSARGPCTAARRDDWPLRRNGGEARETVRGLRRELEGAKSCRRSLRARWATARAEGSRVGRGACNTDRSRRRPAAAAAARQGRHARVLRKGMHRKAASNGRSGHNPGCRDRLRCRPLGTACNPSPRQGPRRPVARLIRVSCPLIPFRSQRVFIQPSGGSLLEITSGRRSDRVQKIVRTGVPGRMHTTHLIYAFRGGRG